ncbi:citrate/2-methylcitrate synthase [Roseibium sp.]|uniref:citrate/2-methylcitrate synthase n=1 Tax=Roseibium sp. TaxID=1936156 RepID=UPI003A973A94
MTAVKKPKTLEIVNIDKYNQYMNSPVYLSAREAATELGVQPATLYAYVSRGLIRSTPGPGKQRRYDASDVRALQTRRDRDPAPGSGLMARADEASTTPLLQTRLTMITADGPYYRGHAVAELAQTSSLEAVATLLWGADQDPFAGISEWSAEIAEVETDGFFGFVAPEALPPLERLICRFATWPTVDRSASAQAPNLLMEKGARLLYAGVSALVDQPISQRPLHVQMADAWGVEDAAGRDLIRAALVLCADHELNTSAYAVRCAASTRAPLHACLIAGLGAFSGPRHGAHSDRVQAWLRDIDEPDTVDPVFAERLNRGEDLPGFGHLLYEKADPRAAMLLKRLQETAPHSLFLQTMPYVLTAGRSYYGLSPNIDFALVALQRALRLPKEAPKLLFCAGRLVGWIAHALEQYQAKEQIRPRANYIGPRPA